MALDRHTTDTTGLPPAGVLERTALTIVRRRGVKGFVVLATVMAVAASLLFSTIAVALTGVAPEASDWWSALLIATVVPAFVVPPATGQVARLIQRLDAMGSRLQTLSVTDPLTGVMNRRGFFQSAERASDGHATAIAIVDLDRFKQLNDARGHGFGDEALVHVATWLREAVGPDGSVARLGGDEFVAIGPAPKIAAMPNRAPFVLDGTDFTASIGTTIWEDGETVDVALVRADVVLYRAKVDNER